MCSDLIFKYDVGEKVKHLITEDVGVVTNNRMDDNRNPIVTIQLLSRKGHMVCREFELKETN